MPFSATLSSNFQTDTLAEELRTEEGLDVDMATPSPWLSLLFSVLPLVLLMGLVYYFLFRRMGGAGGGALSMGKNKVKIYDRKEMKTTFADVAGVDEAKEELKEIVEFLRNPKKYQRLGGRIPKGVLLLGPPGCGKTLLARAVAGEANVPFFFMSGSEFVEMFVGLGAARVRELFQQAKEKAPALVFLDEIDTIGKGRSGAMGSGFGAHDEREQTLNQLLVEMDGFDSQKGVIIMAATNRPDVLDQALVRPGRFDRQVVVDRPDLKGREEILRVHARGVALDPDVELNTIAARTPGFTGADLENVVNEAALLAARRDKNSVTEDELEEAIDRASMGLERKSRVMSEKEKVRVAAHEMGHALVAHYCENLDPVHRITIIPRGTAALGLDDDASARGPVPRDRAGADRHARVRDGRSRRRGDRVRRGLDRRAERPGEGHADRARDGVAVRDERGGRSALARAGGRQLDVLDPKISGGTAEKIDSEVLRLLNDAHEKAERILTERRDLLDRLRVLLLVTETIDGNDLEAYANGTKPIPNAEEAREDVDRRAAAAAAIAARPETPSNPAKDQPRAKPITLPPAPPMPAD